jgi:hypothetical protein
MLNDFRVSRSSVPIQRIPLVHLRPTIEGDQTFVFAFSETKLTVGSAEAAFLQEWTQLIANQTTSAGNFFAFMKQSFNSADQTR